MPKLNHHDHQTGPLYRYKLLNMMLNCTGDLKNSGPKKCSKTTVPKGCNAWWWHFLKWGGERGAGPQLRHEPFYIYHSGFMSESNCVPNQYTEYIS